MNYSIDATPRFEKRLRLLGKKYKSIKQDYANLLEELYANPNAGVDLGDNMHKVRMAIGSKNRGKSHGARVITWLYKINKEEGKILLLTVYDKQDQDNISETELHQLRMEAREWIDIQ